MVDMRVTLFDGAYHELDSSERAFEFAARQEKQARHPRSTWQPIRRSPFIDTRDRLPLCARRGRGCGCGVFIMGLYLCAYDAARMLLERWPLLPRK
jgi:Elongation factor G, domain IV